MDDPRIYKGSLWRQYPYHKQRSWSPQYMCLRHSAAAPWGSGLKLAVRYRKWAMAPAFYELQRALENAIPGVQILGEALTEDESLRWDRRLRGEVAD